MDRARIEINQRLAERWGVDGATDAPGEDFPFRLDYWGEIDGWALYRFKDGAVLRYAGYQPEVGVISGAVADMTLEDLADEFRGGAWIEARGPVGLEEEEGDNSGAVPPVGDRLEAIDQLVHDALGADAEYEILRAYYLEATEAHLALVQTRDGRGEALVVGTDIEPIPIAFRKASPERRLSIALARGLLTG